MNVAGHRPCGAPARPRSPEPPSPRVHLDLFLCAGVTMGGWLDRWARRAATSAPPSPQIATPATSGVAASTSHSRRDFMKKAGVVGGLVWSVPVIQTALAPAASASALCQGGTSTCGNGCDAGLCGNGATCQTSADCINGTCSGGFCGGPSGTSCTTGGNAACRYNNCSSGVCGGLSATCVNSTWCSPTIGCGQGGVCGAKNSSCSGAASGPSQCVSGVCAPVGNSSNFKCT